MPLLHVRVQYIVFFFNSKAIERFIVWHKLVLFFVFISIYKNNKPRCFLIIIKNWGIFVNEIYSALRLERLLDLRLAISDLRWTAASLRRWS